MPVNRFANIFRKTATKTKDQTERDTSAPVFGVMLLHASWMADVIDGDFRASGVANNACTGHRELKYTIAYAMSSRPSRA